MKKLLALLLSAALLLGASGCDDEDWEDYDEEGGSGGYHDMELSPQGHHGDPDQTWTICWYLCGSDLESDYGAATSDLEEMMEVDLPENVQVLVQTGGAYEWQNDTVDPDRIERYLYDSEGLYLVDSRPQANMGSADTLVDFLSFCKEEYPADRTVVVFWNHGGGSVSGASFDENYDFDSLTLSELREAFASVYDLSAQHPPVDMIGFDTCLMATVDAAHAFSDVAEYLVASEEMEPGCGWSYDRWLQALADDPGMDGALLGKAICDSYMEGCEEDWSEDEATLSVVELTKVQPLLEAYEAMGAEALTYALEDPSFFGDFGRQAVRSENYGGNTRDQGYSNMVDLGHLAINCANILPGQYHAVLQGLEDCVVYRVSGDYRENATGLSCYFSYNGDLDDLHGYEAEGCSDSFKYFFDYGIAGEFTDAGKDYINALGYDPTAIPEVQDLQSDGEVEYPLWLDDNGTAVLELDADIVNMLKGVYFQLVYLSEDQEMLLMLGQDNDIDADWDQGVFRDNFRGVWGALDDHFVYMEVVYECEDYTAYSVPILLNGKEYNLRVIYDYNDEAYYILGARRGLDSNGMADKNLVQLQPGDEITPIHYTSSVYGEDGLTAVYADPFTVTKDTAFGEKELGDGIYLMMFELVDAKNNSAYSQMLTFTVDGDETTVEIMD